MNKINLDHIRIPNDLSAVVDESIQRAKAKETVTLNLRRFTSVAAVFAVCLIMLNFNAFSAFASAAKQFFSALYANTFENK
jgi:ribosomal silencing factor RsfS